MTEKNIAKYIINQPAMWRAALRRAVTPRAGDNKYRRGTILIRGGAMAGAGILCATAARRAGAGLVTIFAGARDRAIYLSAQPGLLFSAKSFLCPRNLWRNCLATARQNRAQVIIIGPGCNATRATRRDVIAAIKSGRATLVDAGGITAFANRAPLLRRALQQHPNPNIVFTPHDGELAALNIPTMPPSNKTDDANDSAKIARAATAATYLGAVLLLKGATTIVAAPPTRNAPARVSVLKNCPSILATGGSGDVLSGVIAAILAAAVGRGMGGGADKTGELMDGFLAASAGAYIHAAAARHHKFGMIAEDLPQSIAAILSDIIK